MRFPSRSICASSIAAFLAVFAAKPSSAKAAILYWDQDASATGDSVTSGANLGNTGTTATWDTSTAHWWSGSGSSLQSWNNSGFDTAFFAGSTAGTVTLGGATTVGGLTFGTTGYTIAGGGNTLTFGAASNDIRLRNVAAATISAPIAGSGALILSGDVFGGQTAGTVTFQGNGSAFNGAVTVNNGITLALSGASGTTLSNASVLTLNGGGLTLTNTNATEGALDRVNNSAGISVNGGTITYANTAGSSNSYAETLRVVTLNSGRLAIVSTNATTSPATETLTLSGFVRDAASTSTLAVGGTSLGSNAQNRIVVSGMSATPAGQILGPWATYGSSATTQTDYAIYDATNGFKAAGIAATAETAWTSAANAYTMSGNVTLTGTRTVTGLRMTGGAAGLTLASGANLETYGILNGGSATLTVSTGTGGSLTTPTGGGKLFLNAGSNAITVTAPVVDNAGAVTLVASGTGTVTLSGANSYSGGTVINSGTVTINGDGALGATSGALTVSGSSTLNLSGATTLSANRVINLNNTALLTVGTAGATNNFASRITGTGGLIFTSGGTTTLSNVGNDFAGPLRIANSTTSTTVNVVSLADSATANGAIRLGNSTGTGTFGWDVNAPTSLVLNNRQIDLAGNGTTGGGTINNNSTTQTVTINTDLLVTGAGTSTVAAPKTLTLGGSGNGTFAGRIADGMYAAVSVTKSGVGSWVLSGANTYTGNTTFSAGNLEVSSLASLGTGSLVFNGGALRWATGSSFDVSTRTTTFTGTSILNTNGNDVVLANSVGNAGVGSFTKTGLGTLTLNAANGLNYTGTTTVNQGTLAFGASQTVGALTLGGVASASPIVDLGSNKLTLNNTLTLSSTNGTFTGTITGSTGATLDLAGASRTFAIGDSTNAYPDLVIGAPVTLQNGNVVKTSSGALRIDGTNNLSSIEVQSGQLLGNLGTANLILNGGAYEGNGTFNRSLGTTPGSGLVQWTSGGSGGFSAKGGSFVVTLGVSPNPIVWDSTPGFVAGAGQLTLGSATADDVVTLTNNIDLNSTAAAVTRTVSVTDNATVTTDKAVLSGVLSSSGSTVTFTKAGSGTLELSGTNLFTGTVALNAGTLQFSSAANLGAASNALSVTGTSTLEYLGAAPVTLTGTTTLNANLTINGSAPITFSAPFGETGSSDRTVTINNTGGTTFGDVFLTDSTTGRVLTLNVTGTNTATVNGVVENGTTTGLGSAYFGKNGSGTLILNGANTFTNEFRFNQGTVYLNATPAVTQTATNTIVFNNANVPGATANLVLASGVTYSVGGTVIYVGNSANAQSTASITGSGKVALNGTRTFDVRPSTDPNGKLVMDTEIADGTSLGGISKSRNGVLVLSGNNTYTGGTTVNEGTLQLDYSTHTGSKLSGTAALTMGGALLELVNSSSTAVTQNVGSTVVNQGGSTIALRDTGGAGITLKLGNFTSTAGGRSLDFVVEGSKNVLNTTSPTVNGILGGWGTYNSSAFATVDANGNIVGVTPLSRDAVGTWGVDENVGSVSGFAGTTAGIPRVNSISFAGAANSSIAVSRFLDINSGGVLVSSGVGANSSLISGGNLVSTTGALFFHQHNTLAPLTVASSIRGSLNVAKSGLGELILNSANNDSTGTFYVNRGILSVNGGNAVGDAAPVLVDPVAGATFRLLADETIGSISGGSADGGMIDLGTHTLTLTNGSASSYNGLLVGSGTVVKNGTTLWTLNSVSNPNFTGSFVVNQGVLQLTGSGISNLPSASAITVNAGAGLLIDNNGNTSSSNDRIANAASITLNSVNGLNGTTGPIRGLWVRNSDQNSTRAETVGDLGFNSGSSYATLESSTTSTNTSAISELLAASFTRSNRATVSIRGTNLGSASSVQRGRLRLTTSAAETAFIAANAIGGGTATGTTQSIVPWAIGQDLGVAVLDSTLNNQRGNSLVSYVAGAGFRPLNFTTDYSGFTAAAATANVRESLSADLTALTGKTINSLVLNNSGASAVTVSGSGALVVTSGAFLFTAVDSASATGAELSSPQAITLNGFGTITVGPAVGSVGNEFVFHVADSAAGGVTIGSSLVDSTAGNTAFTKAGLGTLFLTGTNTYSGVTTLNEGVTVINGWEGIGGASSAADLVFAGGTLKLNTGFTGDFNRSGSIKLAQGGGVLDTNGTSLSLNAPLVNLGTMAGSFTKAGAGVLTLNKASGYSGSTAVTGGTLQLGANQAIGTGDLVVNNAALDLQGFNATVGRVTLANAAGSTISGTGTLTSNGSIFDVQQGTVAANLAGSSTLIKSGSSSVTLSGSSSYTGATEVRAGILSFNSIANLGTASALGAPTSVDNGAIRLGLGSTGATLLYTGEGSTSDRRIDLVNTTGTDVITANGTGPLVLNGGILNVGVGSKVLNLNGTQTGTNVIGGAIEENAGGTLGLTVSGSATWLLSGANTYLGTTTLTSGTAIAGNNQAFGFGTLALNGAVLKGDGTARTLANNVTVNASSTLSGSSALAFNGNVTLVGGSRTLTVTNSGGTSFNGATLTLVDSGSTARTLTIAGTGDVTIGARIVDGTAAGSLSVTNTGKLLLTGANAFTGTTTVNAAGSIVRLDGNGVIGGPVTLQSGSLQLAATGADQTFGLVTLGGGVAGSSANISLEAGRKLTLAGGLTFSSTNNNLGATITGQAGSALDLQGGVKTFNVAKSTAATFDVSADANVAVQNGNILKTGAGSLRLQGAVSGDAEIQGGVLNAPSLAGNLLLNGGAYESHGTFTRVFGTGAGQVQWGVNGGGFSAQGGDLAVTLGEGAQMVWGGTTGFMPATTTGPLVLNSTSADSTVTLTNDIDLNNTAGTVTRVIQVNDNAGSSSDMAVLSGVLANSAGVANLVKTGAGVLRLTQSPNHTGTTSIDAGTLIVDSSFDSMAGLFFGSTNAVTTAGTLDLSAAGGSFNGLTVQGNTTAASGLVIGTGSTVAISGNVTIGSSLGTGTTLTDTVFNVSGGGSLIVTNMGTGAAFTVGGYTGAVSGQGNRAVADFSALGSLRVTLNTTTGLIRIGNNSQVNTNNSMGTLILAQSSRLTAATLSVGDGGQFNSSATQTNTLKLGSGTNTIQVNTFNVGTGARDMGAVVFNTPASGTLTVRNAAGTGRAVLNIGTAGGAGTGTTNTTGNTVDLRGHQVDMLLGAVSIGTQNRGNVLNNFFAVDGGSVDMSSLVASTRTANPGTGTAANYITNSSVNFGSAASTDTDTFAIQSGITQFAQVGGTTGSGNGNVSAVLNMAGGHLNIGATNGASINMASANAGNTASATLNFTGGVTMLQGDIVKGGGAGTTTATINVDGGSLDAGGHRIAADTLNVKSGTLSNIGDIVAGDNLTAAPLIKTTSGVVSLEGTNSYRGQTEINAGSFLVNGALLGSMPGAVNVNDSANLGGRGSIAGQVNVKSGGTLNPGVGGLGTLAVGALSLEANSTLALEINSNNAGSADLVSVAGALSLSSNNDVKLSITDVGSGTLSEGSALIVAKYTSGAALNGLFALNGNIMPDYDAASFVPNQGVFVIGSNAFAVDYNYNVGGDMGNVALVVVPEPNAALSMVAAMGGLLGLRRRRKK